MTGGSELQKWVSALRRIPWSAAKPELAVAGIEPSTGWVKTVANLATLDKASKKYSLALQSAKRLFTSHIYIGEKLILWFRVPLADIPLYSKMLLKMKPYMGSRFSSAFPLPVSADELRAASEHDPELASIEDTSDHTSLVFCTRRSFNLREELAPNLFTPKDRAWLEKYQQVVGYKKVEFQAYDVIWLDKKTGLLEFRIDAPEGLSKDDTRTARNVLVEKFYTYLAAVAGTTLPAAAQINFYPAIEKMYKASTEGSVFELYFIATTGSNNFGKMRNKAKDLRTEAFHAAGASTVGITPYRLGVLWHYRSRVFHPELHLPGSLKLFNGVKVQPLHNAFIRNCISFDDYNRVAKNFLKYL